MKAYKTYSTITDTRQVILSEVPFQAGEQVEIVVLSADNERRSESLGRLKDLFKETQALPQAQALSEGDILREIEAYRNGQ